MAIIDAVNKQQKIYNISIENKQLLLWNAAGLYAQYKWFIAILCHICIKKIISMFTW